MEVAAIIPAHLDSVRFPRKVLAQINGKTILQHVYEKVKSTKHINNVYIATADDEIIAEVKSFHADLIRTGNYHTSGTSRISEAASKINADVIINVQADEPLIQPRLLNKLTEIMLDDGRIEILTPVKRIEDSKEVKDVNVVKVVFDKDLNALYFSRHSIPYGGSEFFKHIGVYCFRRDFIINYSGLAKSFLEEEEKLEQLRFLWNGYRIRVFITDFESISVDTKEDFQKVERILR
ncbi:MAG: 3-deoxy-manno-octulosonate cytidylyltransferase [Candidatus Saelkia tenebricola]|nr:3-deoxy-manno-octulosonate cytidylyltransferase [Candidatus Saelkia tenebricola]